MRIVPRGLGVTWTEDLDEVSDASPLPSLTLVNGEGTSLLAASSMTRDTTSTTLTAPAAAGSLEVTVASVTGINRGQPYLIGTSTSEVPEAHRVVKILGTTTLRFGSPLGYDHDDGATVASTRVSLAVAAASLPDAVRYGKARIDYYVGAVAKRIDRQFAVSEHALSSGMTVGKLLRRDPSLLARISAGTDLLDYLERALEEMNAEIQMRFEPFLQRGTHEAYTAAHAYKTLQLLAIPDRMKDAEAFGKLYSEQLSLVRAQPTVDHDDDDAVSPEERHRYVPRTFERM